MANLKLLLSSILILSIFQRTLSVNYCNAKLCNGQKHIACKNKGAFSSACARNAKIPKMTTKLKNAIVAKHNSLRNRLATGKLSGYKPAIRMASMQWSNELANVAAYNVKQCEMRHDSCRNTPTFKNSGQNLAYAIWQGKSRTVKEVSLEHVQMWFDEHKACSMSIMDLFNPTSAQFKKVGHFTTMAQEKNTHVGCAVLRQTKGGKTYQFMACNYAYTNIFDKPVYRKGTAASNCKTGKNPKFKGLCSVKEKYDIANLS